MCSMALMSTCRVSITRCTALLGDNNVLEDRRGPLDSMEHKAGKGAAPPHLVHELAGLTPSIHNQHTDGVGVVACKRDVGSVVGPGTVGCLPQGAERHEVVPTHNTPPCTAT